MLSRLLQPDVSVSGASQGLPSPCRWNHSVPGLIHQPPSPKTHHAGTPQKWKFGSDVFSFFNWVIFLRSMGKISGVYIYIYIYIKGNSRDPQQWDPHSHTPFYLKYYGTDVGSLWGSHYYWVSLEKSPILFGINSLPP